MDRSKIVLILPAKNEEKTIDKVLNELVKISNIILINDFSKDNTYKIATKYNINIINNSKNIGYQNSILKGLIEAKKLNYNYAITFDADGQHLKEDIKLFIYQFEKGYDLVIGQRNFFNRFSEKLLSIFSYKYINTRDIISGMKGYNLNILQSDNLNYKINTYCSELCYDIIKNDNCNFINIPINVIKRKDKSRLGNSFRVNIRILLIIYYLFIKIYKKK